MKKLKLNKKVVIAEETVIKEVEDILKDQKIKEFGKNGAHITVPKQHIGKKAIIGVYKKWNW